MGNAQGPIRVSHTRCVVHRVRHAVPMCLSLPCMRKDTTGHSGPSTRGKRHLVLLKNSADSTQLKSLKLDDHPPNSRCLTMIVAQQPSKTPSTHHLTHLPTNCRLGCNQLVIETLMIALRMIVNQV